nr:UBN2 domain-containing protein [Tanacetum cinerariifolium]
MMKETLYELVKDDQKKELGKNNKAKMTLYNSLPCKEYERVFMYQDYSSKNQVRKFLRALPLKWRANVKAIEKAKDLATLHLDKLIGNLKEVKAQDKSEVAIIVVKKVTSLVSIQSPKKTRPLLEELGVIVKTVMNLKMLQHFSWQSTL